MSITSGYPKPYVVVLFRFPWQWIQFSMFDNQTFPLQNVQASNHHVVKLHEVWQPNAATRGQDQVDAVERGEEGVPGHREGDQDGLLRLPLEALVNLEGCAG